MSSLPYTYVDPDGRSLVVDTTGLFITGPTRGTRFTDAPTGEDAVALARAVLANPRPGDVRYVVVPEWQVIDPRELAAEKRAYAEAVARSMREQASDAAETAGSATAAVLAIRALPLLPDATEGSKP